MIDPDRSEQEVLVLTRLAHVTIRHRWAVIGAWPALSLFGVSGAGKVSTRWSRSFSASGRPAYDASQRMLKAFGVGVRPPNVVVFHTPDNATKSRAIETAMQGAAATMPGARSSSYFSTVSLIFVSRDRHTTFEEIYSPRPGAIQQQERRGEDARCGRGWPAGGRTSAL